MTNINRCSSTESLVTLDMDVASPNWRDLSSFFIFFDSISWSVMEDVMMILFLTLCSHNLPVQFLCKKKKKDSLCRWMIGRPLRRALVPVRGPAVLSPWGGWVMITSCILRQHPAPIQHFRVCIYVSSTFLIIWNYIFENIVLTF